MTWKATRPRVNAFSPLRRFYHDTILPHNLAIDFYKAASTTGKNEIKTDVFKMLLSDRFSPNELCEGQSPRENSQQFAIEAVSSLIGRMNSIVFATEEGHVGATNHPDPLTAVQAGDIVVGLFGITNLSCFVRCPGRTAKSRHMLW